MWVGVTAAVTGLATIGLILLAAVGDLDTAAEAASVAGSVASLAALLVSVVALFWSGGGSATGRRVRAGRRAIAVGGNVTGSAVGKDLTVTGSPTSSGTTPRTSRDGADVRAGTDGIAVGGDVTDSAIGEGGQR
ncbi:hypothetical protein [Streptomyces justiciae]|uniref:Uncharacterized protein n=1 Tax=Streptomyces justiciae TaxID=2780140 RepID=A0ABU3M8L2_9ACTN|nr:hypothetical protein [Streptomyces justiciae]MDT7847851.1 hypothetical protein [Streptomyces justiciae]